MKYSEGKISQRILSLKVIYVLFDKKTGTSKKKYKKTIILHTKW